MAEKSCRPAFSLPFHRLIVARQIDFSNEVPGRFNLLPAVAAGFIRRMNDTRTPYDLDGTPHVRVDEQNW